MKLMTVQLEKRFAEVGRQEFVEDPLVIAKFFHPMSGAAWYATEYCPDDKVFFGYVTGLVPECDEWGYFNLAELESVRIWGVSMERDLYFREKRFSQLGL